MSAFSPSPGTGKIVNRSTVSLCPWHQLKMLIYLRNDSQSLSDTFNAQLPGKVLTYGKIFNTGAKTSTKQLLKFIS